MRTNRFPSRSRREIGPYIAAATMFSLAVVNVVVLFAFMDQTISAVLGALSAMTAFFMFAVME